MITFSLLIIVLYSILAAGVCRYFGMFPIPNKKNRMKCYFFDKKTSASSHISLIEACIFGLSLYLNLLFSILTATGDSAFFVSITQRFSASPAPFAAFYEMEGITYPPLFNYIYYLWSQLLSLCSIPLNYTNEAFIFSVKLPGILCEFFMAGLLYRYAQKNLPKGQTIPVLLLILLNPGYLFLTAYICQIDALYTFFMLLTVYLICRQRLKLSYFSFAAAALCKFQTIFISPVIIYATIHTVFFHNFSWKKFWQHLICGLSAIFCMFLSYLPFVWNFKEHTFYKGGILINFTSSLKSYGFATQNTYNFWTLTGYNSYSEDLYFGFFTCKQWGTIFLILLVFLCTVLFLLHENSPDIYPMLSAALVSGTVCFATRMMSRYLYPAVVLLLFGFILKPTCRRCLCVLLFTAALFLLNIFSYLVYPLKQYSPELLLPRILSVYLLGCFVFLIFTLFREISEKE